MVVMAGRLRQLGASYFLVETCGTRGQMYRFHCRAPLSDATRFVRQFESVRPDPLEAMRDVVGQVQAWRNGPDGS